MNTFNSYKFIPIERVTFQEVMQMNTIIIISENHDRIVYQLLNSGPSRFIKYIQENKRYKLIKSNHDNNVYVFEKGICASSV